MVTGLKIALDGTGAVGGGGCAPARPERHLRRSAQHPRLLVGSRCRVRLLPRLRRAGRELHHDRDPDGSATTNTVFQLRALATTWRSCRRARPGRRTTGTCGPVWSRPTADLTPSRTSRCPDTRAFRKARRPCRVCPPPTRTPLRSRSTGRTTTTPTGPIAYGGELGNQTAKTYRIQVDNDPSFSSPDRHARSWTRRPYTAYDELYPEGTYFWRVQARDVEDQRPDLVAPSSRSPSPVPAVAPSSPVGGVQVPGHHAVPVGRPALRRVVHGGGLQEQRPAFSAANRVFSATVKTTAYAPPSPIPAAGTPYVWRVRRNDVSGNPGPWSRRAVVLLVRRGAEPAQPGSRHLAEERGCPVRVDRGAGCGELQAQHHRQQAPAA